jgi:hypothetical protein
MPRAIPSSASASAWSGLSIVDNTSQQLRDRVVLNNSLAADHTVAGLDNNQKLGDVVTLINRGTKNLAFNSQDTTANAKDRFTSSVFIPAGGKVQIYYNGTRWEAFTDAPGGVISRRFLFTEDATSTTHTATCPIPAGAILHGIEVLNEVLWGAASASLKVGDTADDDGYFVGVDCKATDLVVGEVLDTQSSTLWGGKEGAYLVAATGRRGPTSANFSKYYKAGSNITGIMTVGTPAVTTGRTHMIVKYSVPSAEAAVAA